jgi:flagellar biosynthesis GTPase FlhF
MNVIRIEADCVTNLWEQVRQRSTSRFAEENLVEAEAELGFPADSPDATVLLLSQRLESFGLLRSQAHRVAQQVQRVFRSHPPVSAAEELTAVATVLLAAWREPPRTPPGPAWHVFVGAAGTGKTTCLCKWLAQTVLLTGGSARVWRLDGLTANTAESLSVMASVLGVPVVRAWPPHTPSAEAEMHFVDLPGVDWRSPGAIDDLAQRTRELPAAHIHLVLNAAYETSILLRQAEAFASLPISDLIVTHLDEEPHWGKLWNLVLGTEHALGFLSAGQSVPGDFRTASATPLIPRQWPRFDGDSGNPAAWPCEE